MALSRRDSAASYPQTAGSSRVPARKKLFDGGGGKTLRAFYSEYCGGTRVPALLQKAASVYPAHALPSSTSLTFTGLPSFTDCHAARPITTGMRPSMPTTGGVSSFSTAWMKAFISLMYESV